MPVLEPLPNLLEVYRAIPGPMLFGLALAAVAPVVSGTWAHLRHWWLHKRLERRLARNGYMLVEEHRDHLFAMGEEPPPIDWLAMAMNALISALLVGAAGVMFALGREWEWEIALMGVGALGMLYGLWRRINDPPVADEEDEPPASDGETAIIVGIFGFLGIIALLAVIA